MRKKYTEKLLSTKIVSRTELKNTYDFALKECMSQKDGKLLVEITDKFAEEYYGYKRPNENANSTKKTKTRRNTKPKPKIKADTKEVPSEDSK